MATSVRCLVGVRHLARLLTLMVLLRRGVVRCAQLAVTTDQIPPSANKSRIDNDGVAGEGLFSSEWLQGFGDGDVGCDSGRGSFAWRRHGFGSNVNNLLNAWVYAIAVEGWTDLSVIIAADQLHYVMCEEESQGQALSGWNCAFSPTPHLCTFETSEEWTTFMASRNVSNEELEEAARLDQDTVRFHPEKIVRSLEERSDVDHAGALAAMAKHLWGSITPWLQDAVHSVVRSTETFEQSPYLGIHIRRGDKVTTNEAEFIPAEAYLSAAVEYIQGGDAEDGLSIEDIKGIWVASDDPSAVEEVRAVAPMYLPNVDNSSIVCVSGGVEGGPDQDGVQTYSSHQTYGGLVYMFTDLQQLTAADVFIGTFSSNLGRLLLLLRESVSQKPRSSTISVDRAWVPGRRHRWRGLDTSWGAGPP